MVEDVMEWANPSNVFDPEDFEFGYKTHTHDPLTEESKELDPPPSPVTDGPVEPRGPNPKKPHPLTMQHLEFDFIPTELAKVVRISALQFDETEL